MKKIKQAFLGLVVLAACMDLVTAYIQAASQLNAGSNFQLHDLAYQFMGLENLFKNTGTIGYYTDMAVDNGNPLATAQYEQAQYVLAPTVLDLNGLKHHWVLMACSSPQKAIEVMKANGLVPLKANHGIILAVNPGVSE